MFAKDFQKEDVMPMASEGLHKVKIQKVYEEDLKDKHALTIEIVYKGGKKMVPDRIRIFDLPPCATEKERKAFNYKLSAFCNCFDIEGKFNIAEYQFMKDKEGVVKVERDGNGYLTIGLFVPRTQEGDLYVDDIL